MLHGAAELVGHQPIGQGHAELPLDQQLGPGILRDGNERFASL